MVIIEIMHDGRKEDYSLPYRQSFDSLAPVDILAKLKRKETRPEKPSLKTIYYVPRAYDYMKDLMLILKKEPSSVSFETIKCTTGTRSRVRLAKKALVKDIEWCDSEDKHFSCKYIIFNVT